MKKRCAKCGKIKDSSEFYKHKATKDGLHSWCKKCIFENYTRWRKEHRERYSRKKRAWTQKNYTRTTDKVIKGKKRKRPKDGICELCGRECDKEKRPLFYHHWDDNNLLKGIWVCFKCHGLVEGFTSELAEKWIIFKEKINHEAEKNRSTQNTIT